MRRWLILWAVLALQQSGCLYYAYPTVAVVPALTVPNPDGSVHAFRVDIDHTQRPPLTPIIHYTLAKVPVDERGQVPSQLEVASASGIYNPLGLGDTGPHERSEYTMFMRFYRPGYQTQEVQAGERSRMLIWVPAADLPAQEKALDELLAAPATRSQPTPGSWWDLKDDKNAGQGLQPGGIAPMHGNALRFAANEYQRLANSPAANTAPMQNVRDRLRSKSQWLRTFADRQPAP